MTNDLINRLAGDMEAISPDAMRWLLLRHAAGGLAAGFIVMLVFLGIRNDLLPAMTTAVFWAKLGYATLLILILAPTALILSRPIRIKIHWWPTAVLLLCLVVAALFQWANALPEERKILVWGRTALVCPWLILLISLPMLASLLAAMRKLAPANPALAGLAAGIVSGASGVLIYAFHCPESGIPFIAIWYTFGVAITGILGGLGGRILLRW